MRIQRSTGLQTTHDKHLINDQTLQQAARWQSNECSNKEVYMQLTLEAYRASLNQHSKGHMFFII